MSLSETEFSEFVCTLRDAIAADVTGDTDPRVVMSALASVMLDLCSSLYGVDRLGALKIVSDDLMGAALREARNRASH